MGRLVHTPELKATPQGVMVCKFSIAVDRSYKALGEERQTDFFDCVAWREKAEFVSRHFAKGGMIAVQGEMQTRSYEGRDGTKRKAVELIVSQANFTGERRQDSPPDVPLPPRPAPPKPPAAPQQQSMFPGHRGPQMAAPPLAPASQADFEEIGCDDDLPF
jgi:single-strand DNA-binding protein